MVSARDLARELLDSFQGLSRDVRVVESLKKLDKAASFGNERELQRLLNVHVNLLSDIVLESSVRTVVDPRFAVLSDVSKAKVIREYVSLGVEQGFSEAAKAAYDVNVLILKSGGVTVLPEYGVIDQERLKGAVSGSITHAIDNDLERLSTTMTDSFSQIIRSGSRSTTEATTKKVQEKTGAVMLIQRVTGSSRPCEYCIKHSGEWFRASSDAATQAYRFHDSCRCRIEMKVEVEEKDEFYLDDEDDFDFDDIDLEDVPFYE